MLHNSILSLPSVQRILSTAAAEIENITGEKVSCYIKPNVQYDEERDVPVLKHLVEMHFGVNWKALSTPCRKQTKVDARHTYMYIAHTIIGRSLQKCANDVGRSDHTSTWHAIEKINHFYDIKDKLIYSVEKIKNELNHAITIN